MAQETERIQVSVKIPKSKISFLALLDPFERSKAVNIAIEMAEKYYYLQKAEIAPKSPKIGVLNSEIELIYKDETYKAINPLGIAEIAPKSPEIGINSDFLFDEPETEIAPKSPEIDINIDHLLNSKILTEREPEIAPKSPEIGNTIEINLNEIGADVAEYLKQFGFEEMRYVTETENARINKKFETVLQAELERLKIKYETIIKNIEPQKISDTVPEEFKACVIELIKGYARYSNSKLEKFTTRLDEMYITELYFTHTAKNMLIQ